jgi:hypothetical protein
LARSGTASRYSPLYASLYASSADATTTVVRSGPELPGVTISNSMALPYFWNLSSGRWIQSMNHTPSPNVAYRRAKNLTDVKSLLQFAKLEYRHKNIDLNQVFKPHAREIHEILDSFKAPQFFNRLLSAGNGSLGGYQLAKPQ